MSAGKPNGTPLVFVTVGTDHHPFDRLIAWIDAWLARKDHPGSIRCIVQHGSSSPPSRAEGVEILPFEDVLDLTRRASVVVSQAGPASVALTRKTGRKPIVVPRRQEHGEHVDDHQVVFAERLDRDGRAVMADSEPALRAALDRGLADPAWLSTDGAVGDDPPRGVERFAQIADELLAEGDVRGRPDPLSLGRRLHRLRYIHLAGFQPEEYELYGLAGRGRAEAGTFVSESQLHNVIRPALNDWRYEIVLEDKWLSARFFESHGIPSPLTLGHLHPEVGEDADGSPLRTADDLGSLLARARPAEIVVKPVGGLQGAHVTAATVGYGERIELEIDRRRLRLDEFVDFLPGQSLHGIEGYLIQERVDQHPDLAEINPDTLNTLRVRTVIRSDGSVDVPRAVLRVGRRGQLVDNFETGGLTVPLMDLGLGILGEGFRKPRYGGDRLSRHPDTGAQLQSRRVPCWPEVLALCERAALTLPALRVVGWDVAVTPDGPVLVEGNADWEPVQSGREGFLTPPVKSELATLGIDRPEADPTVGAALRRARRRIGRFLVRSVARWSRFDPRSERR